MPPPLTRPPTRPPLRAALALCTAERASTPAAAAAAGVDFITGPGVETAALRAVSTGAPAPARVSAEALPARQTRVRAADLVRIILHGAQGSSRWGVSSSQDAPINNNKSHKTVVA